MEVEDGDPCASKEEVEEEYGFTISPEIRNKYDAIIIAVNQHQYLNLDENYYKSICRDKSVIVDLKGIFKEKIKRDCNKF